MTGEVTVAEATYEDCLRAEGLRDFDARCIAEAVAEGNLDLAEFLAATRFLASSERLKQTELLWSAAVRRCTER